MIPRRMNPFPKTWISIPVEVQQVSGGRFRISVDLASDAAPMPYYTARATTLNRSRTSRCVFLVASGGAAPACFTNVKYGSPDTIEYKTGAKMVHHARYVTFQLAEVAIPRWLYRTILDRIRRFAAITPRASPT